MTEEENQRRPLKGTAPDNPDLIMSLGDLPAQTQEFFNGSKKESYYVDMGDFIVCLNADGSISVAKELPNAYQAFPGFKSREELLELLKKLNLPSERFTRSWDKRVNTLLRGISDGTMQLKKWVDAFPPEKQEEVLKAIEFATKIHTNNLAVLFKKIAEKDDEDDASQEKTEK